MTKERAMTRNGRERMEEILNKKKRGGFVWTTLVEDITMTGMPEPYRSMKPLEFYRHIGCDIFQFGNSGLGENECYKSPVRMIRPDMKTTVTYEGENNKIRIEKTETEWGTLLAKSTFGVHPVKHPVTNVDELRIFRKIWENTSVEEVPGAGATYARTLDAIGDDGILVEVFEASPLQHLLEFDLGMENTYYLLEDEPHEVEELMAVIHEKRKEQYEIMAKHSKARAFLPIENTSTTYISPQFYEKYTVPQLRDYVEIMHRHGKSAIIHMCGKVLRLLELFKGIGADGIHALCEPDVGDTPFEEAFRVLGDDLIIVAIIDSAVFMDPNATKEDLERIFQKQIRPNIYEKNVIYAAPADGMPMAYWKFEYLNEWIHQNIR